MSPTQPSADAALNQILGCARSFTGRHTSDPAVGLTYGYFTQHPVAPLNRKRLRAMLRRAERQSLDLKRPLRILDLACGGGLITCSFASMGHRALGLDLSGDEIRMAKLFAQEEKLDGMFLQVDLLKDPSWEKNAEQILGGKPDLVTLAYALHHLPEVEGFVARLSRWLEPGSALLINEENPDSPLFRLKHRVRTWIQKDTDVEWHRSFPAWKEMLEKQSFKVESPLVGLDLLPALGSLNPERCWSLVFTAQRS